MGVKVREKVKGSNIWWVFVIHDGKRVSRRVGDKKSALEAKRKIEARLALGELPIKEQKKTPTLAEYYKRFKAGYMSVTLKKSTFISYETSFRIHILPELGNYHLDEIDAEKIEEFIAKLTEKKVGKTDRTLARDSIRLVVAALRISFKRAIKHKLVTENPATELGEFYRQVPKRHEVDPLNGDEVVMFLNATRNHCPEHYALFLTALHTGMRSGELAALKWEDVDFFGKFIHVRRQYVRGQIQTLKSATTRRNRETALRRKVDCSDELLDTLKWHRKRWHEEWIKKGQNEIPEWVFANKKANPPDMGQMKARKYKPMLKKAGLRSRRWHDLRHTYASLLLSKGVPVLYVSKQLGHSNPDFTMRVYATWIPSEGQRDALNQHLPSLKQKKEIAEVQVP
ncbi:site-specific integrase [Acidobacteria bacterium AH-259-O06]|nr:site-specific integrase [Acidobacteria bacterium AH-259-O06]